MYSRAALLILGLAFICVIERARSGGGKETAQMDVDAHDGDGRQSPGIGEAGDESGPQESHGQQRGHSHPRR